MPGDYRDDDDAPTPPGKRAPGRYHEHAAPEPLPPAPSGPAPRRARTPLPLPLAVPQEVDDEPTGRILLIDDRTARVEAWDRHQRRKRDSMPPPPRAHWWAPFIGPLAGMVLTAVVGVGGWLLFDVRDGLRDRPTRPELQEATDRVAKGVDSVRAELRDVERALDRLTGALEAGAKPAKAAP